MLIRLLSAVSLYGATHMPGTALSVVDEVGEDLSRRNLARIEMLSQVDDIVVGPSGDTSGIADRITIQSAVSSVRSTQSQRGKVRLLRGEYVFDRYVDFRNRVAIVLDEGVNIKLRDSLTRACTYANGNATVTGIDTTGIYAGMLVSDPGANLAANDPFGGIPYNTTVSSVGANSVVLSAAPTAGGSSLVFHATSFLFRAQSVDDWALVCPGGWATLDGNWPHAYPYATSDGRGDSCIRIVHSVNYDLDGLILKDAFYHGLIGVGRIGGAWHPRIRTTGCGYRGLHYHSETISPYTTPEIRDNWFGRVVVEDGGHRSFKTLASNENSGLFAVFANVINTQMDSVLIKDQRGNGFHATGFPTGGEFDPNYPSRHVQVSNLIAENCYNGVAAYQVMKHVKIANLNAWGKVVRVSGCATLAAAAATEYYVNETGTPGSIKIKAIQCPAGTIAANGIREGLRVCASLSGTGIPTDGVRVWKVEIGAGAGGTDWVWVYDDDNTAGDPYNVVNTGQTVSFYWAGGIGVRLYDVAGDTSEDIHIGSATIVDHGRCGVSTQYSSTEFRTKDLHIGSLHVEGSLNGFQLNSVNRFVIGKLSTKNLGSLTNSGIQSGGHCNLMQNCANFDIRNFSYEHTASNTNNLERLRIDADCRNGHVHPTAVFPPTGDEAINSLVTSGAGANAAGVAGPVVLVNPRTNAGAAMTVTGTQLARTNANATIVWRPTDAGDAG